MRPRPAGSLKAAIAALVHAAGGLEAVAAEPAIGRGVPTVHRWTDDGPVGEADYPGVDKVAVMERLAGDPMVTRWLAARAGCLLLRVAPDEAAEADELLARDFADLGERFGRLAAEWARDVADRSLDPGELRRVRAELLRVATAVAVMLGHVDDRLGPDGPARGELP